MNEVVKSISVLGARRNYEFPPVLFLTALINGTTPRAGMSAKGFALLRMKECVFELKVRTDNNF